MPAAKRPATSERRARPGRVVGGGSALLVDQAQVDVGAGADRGRVAQRREARAQAEPPGGLAHDLLHDDAAIGGGDALGGRDGDLELVLAVLGQEQLGLGAGVAQRGHHERGEGLGQALGLERERRGGPVLVLEHELVLERGL